MIFNTEKNVFTINFLRKAHISVASKGFTFAINITEVFEENTNLAKNGIIDHYEFEKNN